MRFLNEFIGLDSVELATCILHTYFLLTINMILLHIPSAGFLYWRVRVEKITTERGMLGCDEYVFT